MARSQDSILVSYVGDSEVQVLRLTSDAFSGASGGSRGAGTGTCTALWDTTSVSQAAA